MKILCFLTLFFSLSALSQILGGHGSATPVKMIINADNQYSEDEKNKINENPEIYFKEFTHISRQIFHSYQKNLKKCGISNVSTRKIKNYSQFIERHLAVMASLSDPDQIKKEDNLDCKVSTKNQPKLECLIPSDQKNFMATLFSHPAFVAYLKTKEKINETQVQEIHQTFKALKASP